MVARATLLWWGAIQNGGVVVGSVNGQDGVGVGVSVHVHVSVRVYVGAAYALQYDVLYPCS